jgi:allophanate hydrolase
LTNASLAGKRCGIPRPEDLQFFGDHDYARLFETAVEQLRSLGWKPVAIDLAPFLETARLLYEGPWVAERFAAVGDFLQANPSAALDVTRQIIMRGSEPSASAAFRSQYRLMALKRACETQWAAMDLLLIPTAGTIYTVAALEADPVGLNSNLGYYTNFMNLLDLAGVAVPAGFRTDGLPFGVSLVGRSSSERGLLGVADRLHRACVTRLGATTQLMEPPEASPLESAPRPGYTALAVCGAHMEGLPLNPQLLERGAYFLRSARTAEKYRLFALAGGPPQRPGLIRVSSDGVAIALEIWAIPLEQLGSFMAAIPPPLGLGTIELQDGSTCKGFLCEGYVAPSATDISRHGGWRGYLAAGGAGGAGWTKSP